MDQSVVFEYSPLLIPLCLILGMIYAVVLYFRNPKEEFSTTLNWVLGLSRMLIVAILAFLLLGPSIRSLKHLKEKPILLIAADNSQSLVAGADSSWYRSTWPQMLNEFSKEESEKFDVRPYLFGSQTKEGINLNYQDKYTNLSNLYEQLETKYTHRNIGALVIASDGIVNQGSYPLNLGDNMAFPVYAVALGDTNLKKDLIINKINFNRIAYLDNSFPVEIIVNGKKMRGETIKLHILKDGKIVHEETVKFNSEDDYQHILVKLKAEKTGTQRYTVQLAQQPSEVILANNQQDFFIDILNGKQKILLLANSPHPDIAALDQSLSGNLNFTVDVKLASDFEGSVGDYNLLVLHGLPSKKHSMTAVMKEVSRLGLPVLFIVSEQTDLNVLNTLNPGLTIDTKNVIYNEAGAKFNADFTAFRIAEDAKNEFAEFPPLYSPYTDMQLLASAHVVMYQQIGQVLTENPLLMLYEDQDRKNGILLGEGIWRWRLADFEQRGTHQRFDLFFNKIIRFLTLKVDKSLFRVYCKNSFDAGDKIEFTAEVYNDSYELVNDAPVSIDISNAEGKRFPFEFIQTGKTYYLNAGNLPEGNYSYTARVQNGGKLLAEAGEFTIKPVVLELVNTLANHNLLYNLAKNKGGTMYFPNQLNQLATDLNNRDDIKTVVYTKKQFSDLLDLPLFFAIIILLLSLEWFLRKRSGSY